MGANQARGTASFFKEVGKQAIKEDVGDHMRKQVKNMSTDK